MAACRVQFTWWGVQRALTADQKAQAAQAFDAEGGFLSAGKKLLDTKHTAFRAVTAIRTKIGDYWKGLSLPFPEPGIRLIKLDAVEEFDRQMADYKAELDDAVANLDRHFDELKQAAARRLGSLFNPSDYPETLRRALRRLVRLPLDRAARLPGPARTRSVPAGAGASEGPVRGGRPAGRAVVPRAVRRVITHLTERITGTNEDGTPKVFRDSVVDNLDEFFERFRSLNVRSNQQLDDLVAQAQRAVRNVGAQDLRDSEATREPGGHAALAGAGVAGRHAGGPAAAADPPQRAGSGGRVMKLLVRPDGTVRAIYDEAIDLAVLGRPTITRASHVEPERARAAGWPT